MNRKTCFFIGHRDVSQEIYPVLYDTIEKHITEYGVTEFIVGKYGNFDKLAAKAVIAVKQMYPQVKLLLLTPYHPAKQTMTRPKGFDEIYFPEGMEKVPPKAAIIRANQYVINHSEYLIAYVHHSVSNAKELVAYAQKRERIHPIVITMLPKERQSE